MFGGKKLIATVMLVLSMAAGVVGYGYNDHQKNQSEFFGDGYILTVQETSEGTITEPVYFNAGTSYKVGYPSTVTFKSMDGEKFQTEQASFLHYADGSIGSMTDGVLMELDELKNGYINYYNVSKDSIMRNDNGVFKLDNNGVEMEFSDFVWKLSEEKYLVSSGGLQVLLPNKEGAEFGGYVELNYLDEGIVQIVGEEQSYQVLTTGTNITLANGMAIDADNRMIMDGEVSMMTLNAIEMNSATNINIVPSDLQAQMKVPTFDITTIDGINGETGAAGESGEAGDDGDIGETGVAGEVGETGAAGLDGDLGVEGAKGNNGSKGSSGSDGGDGKIGDEGKKGIIGGSGGTIGTGSAGSGGSGSGSSGSDSVVMPVVSVEKFEYDAGKLTGTLIVEEGVNVTLGDAILSITDVMTNEKSTIQTYNLQSEMTLDFTKVGLKSDREYRVSLDGEYVLEKTDDSGTTISGTRTFFVRTFNTNSLGVSEEYEYATKDSLVLTLKKKEFSKVTNYTVECTPVKGDVYTAPQSGTFEKSEVKIQFNNLYPDTEYKITFKVINPDATDTPTQEISTHYYKTLKTPPTLGGAPIVAYSPRGYFEFKPGVILSSSGEEQEVLNDPNNGITLYRYDIYTVDTEYLVASVSSQTTNPTTAFIDGLNIRFGVYYKAKLVVEFYDNEKTVEYETDFSESFYADAQTGTPYMMFISDEHVPDETDPDYTDPVTGTVRAESLDGTLHFFFNNANIDISSTNKLRFTVYSEAFISEKELITYTSAPNGTENPISYKLAGMVGLRANTTYRFNAYGYYDGETSESLLATCIVNTTEPKPLTIHIENDKDGNEALNAKIYFTSENNTDDDQLEIHTFYQMNLSLYDGMLKKGSAVITLGPQDIEHPQYTSEAAQYYGTDGKNYLKISNVDFNLGAAEFNNASGQYEIRVDNACAYDYTAVSELRYHTGEYSNKIPLNGDTKATIVATKTAPPLPEPGMKVTAILNESMNTFGFERVQSLPGTTIMGFALIPQYDNTAQYATWADYYIYENTEYNSYMDKLATNQDWAKDDPLKKSDDSARGGYTPLFHYQYDLTEVKTGDDGLLPRLVVMMGEVPESMKNQAYGTITSQDSEWNGVRYVYADKYNPKLNDETVTNKDEVPRVERGKIYQFPYDINLDINGNEAFRYPYMYTIIGTGGYENQNNILKTVSPVEVPRAEPTVSMYPDEMWNEYGIWKVKVIDVDNALSLDSFYMKNAKGNTAVSGTLDAKEDELIAANDTEFIVNGKLDISEYLNTFREISFPVPSSTSETESGLGLYMKYRSFYEEGGDPEKDPAPVYTDVQLTSYPYQKMFVPDTSSLQVSLYQGNNMSVQETIQTNNALIFDLSGTVDSFKNAVGVRVTISTADNSVAQKQFYLTIYSPTVTADGKQHYEANLNLTYISEFLSKTMIIDTELIYETEGYGYKQQVNKGAGLYSLQDSAGLYYVEDAYNHVLNGTSDRFGSILELPEGYEFSESTQMKINYVGKIRNHEGVITLTRDQMGFVWSGTTARNQTVVLKKLSTVGMPKGSNIQDGVTFTTIRPTISSITIRAGLEQAEMEFGLTSGVDQLLEGGNAAIVKFEIFKRTTGTNGELSDVKVATISNKTLAQLKADGTGSYYKVLITGLEKDSQYFIKVSGPQKDENNVVSDIVFLDENGKENYIEFHTLGQVEAKINKTSVYNQSYQNKWIQTNFDLNTISGINLRYDLYEITENTNAGGTSGSGSEGGSTGEALTRTLVYSHKDLVEKGIIRIPDLYSTTGNIIAFNMAPSVNNPFKHGHYYQVVVTSYTEDITGWDGAVPPDQTVNSTVENAGTFELFKNYYLKGSYCLRIPTYADPSPRIVMNLADGQQTGNTMIQNMNCMVSLLDSAMIIPSDYKAQYVLGTGNQWTATKVFDTKLLGGEVTEENVPGITTGTVGEEKPDTEMLHGAYIIRIYEAQYTNQIFSHWKEISNSDEKDSQGKAVNLKYFANEAQFDAIRDDNVVRGWKSINLTNLKEDTDYKIEVYAKVDKNLQGATVIGGEIRTSDMDNMEANGVVLLGYNIHHTLDENGIYINADTIELEQKSGTEVSTYLYNAAGMDKIKYVEYNFVSEEMNVDSMNSSVYTGMIELVPDGSDVSYTETEDSSGRTMEIILKNIEFSSTGRYRVVMSYYNNPDIDPIFQTTKYFRVRTASAPEVASRKYETFRPLLAYLPDNKKRKVG